MHYVFIIIILALAGGGYYEYSVQDKQINDLKRQISDWKTKAQALQDTVTKLGSDCDTLTKNIADTKTSSTDLTTKVSDVKNALKTAQEATDQAKKAAQDAQDAVDKSQKDLDTVLHPAPTNKLGSITTLNGKTYEGCLLKEVGSDGITVNVPKTKVFVTILYPFLPGALQKKFGFDPQHASELSPSQVREQEGIRLKNGVN